jgi:hypothetical protein
MDDLGERTGRSYRSDTGVDQTSHDVARDTREAEEAQRESNINYSRAYGVLPEHNARKEATAEELAIMAQMDAKQERKRQEALAAAATDIAIQKAHMEQREMEAEQARRQAQHQADLESHPQTPQTEPAGRENPVFAFFKGLKGLFPKRKVA